MRTGQFAIPVLAGLGLALGLAFTYPRKPHPLPREKTRVERADPRIAPSSHSTTPSTAVAAIVKRPESPATLQNAPAALPARHDPDAEPHEQLPALLEQPIYDESVMTLSEEHQRPASEVGVSEVNRRATALRTLSSSSSDDPVGLLEQTLKTDVVRNRLLAINSLRALAKDPVYVERATAVLRIAMSDPDDNVATSARDAYQEVAK
jgi:hypothetical protein